MKLCRATRAFEPVCQPRGCNVELTLLADPVSMIGEELVDPLEDDRSGDAAPSTALDVRFRGSSGVEPCL